MNKSSEVPTLIEVKYLWMPVSQNHPQLVRGCRLWVWDSGFQHVPVTIVWQLENYRGDTCTAYVLLVRAPCAHTKELPGLFREVGVTSYPVVGQPRWAPKPYAAARSLPAVG